MQRWQNGLNIGKVFISLCFASSYIKLQRSCFGHDRQDLLNCWHHCIADKALYEFRRNFAKNIWNIPIRWISFVSGQISVDFLFCFSSKTRVTNRLVTNYFPTLFVLLLSPRILMYGEVVHQWQRFHARAMLGHSVLDKIFGAMFEFCVCSKNLGFN